MLQILQLGLPNGKKCQRTGRSLVFKMRFWPLNIFSSGVKIGTKIPCSSTKRSGAPSGAYHNFVPPLGSAQRGREVSLLFQQAGFRWAGAQEVHMTRLQVVDAALDFHLTGFHLLFDQGAVLQEKVNGVKDIQLDGPHPNFILSHNSTIILIDS